MQSNIGMLDRYVRLLSGLLLFGCASAMKRSSPLARGALLTLGAMKIAEGVTGWCPMAQAAEGERQRALPAGGEPRKRERDERRGQEERHRQGESALAPRLSDEPRWLAALQEFGGEPEAPEDTREERPSRRGEAHAENRGGAFPEPRTGGGSAASAQASRKRSTRHTERSDDKDRGTERTADRESAQFH
ncbi:MAG: DUF2892 domain-containing protein [Alicyclobacillus sp.]|nr:DUF2892 domain-containing protein [Alicyclobacillus sp.]